MNKRLSLFWFILGVGSELQVLFSLSISEILVLIAAPFLLISEVQQMRRHGALPFFYATVLLFCGCVVSLIVNQAEYYQVIRGVSITAILVCAVIVGHYMLRNDPNGLKWYFIGVMLSGFICIFAFQKSVEVASVHGTDVDSIEPKFQLSKNIGFSSNIGGEHNSRDMPYISRQPYYNYRPRLVHNLVHDSRIFQQFEWVVKPKNLKMRILRKLNRLCAYLKHKNLEPQKVV